MWDCLTMRRSWTQSCPTYMHEQDRKSTRLNSSHSQISYAVFCLKKKKVTEHETDGFVMLHTTLYAFFASQIGLDVLCLVHSNLLEKGDAGSEATLASPIPLHRR